MNLGTLRQIHHNKHALKTTTSWRNLLDLIQLSIRLFVCLFVCRRVFVCGAAVAVVMSRMKRFSFLCRTSFGLSSSSSHEMSFVGGKKHRVAVSRQLNSQAFLWSSSFILNQQQLYHISTSWQSELNNNNKTHSQFNKSTFLYGHLDNEFFVEYNYRLRNAR